MPPLDCQIFGAESLPDTSLQPQDRAWDEQHDLCGDENRKSQSLGRVFFSRLSRSDGGWPALRAPPSHCTHPCSPATAGGGHFVTTLRAEAERPRAVGYSLTPPLFSWAPVPQVRADLPLIHAHTFACGPHPQEPSVISVSGTWTF